MKPGFVILSHDRPEQLYRLVSRLVSLYEAPVVVHHDFDKSQLDTSRYAGLPVRFVQPHIVTNWGGMPACNAVLSGVALLHEWQDPDWFFLMSASDYPIRRAADVLAELADSRWDAYMDHQRITYHSVPSWSQQPPTDPPFGFHASTYPALAYDRYVSVVWRNIPSLTKRLRFTRRQIRFRHPWLLRTVSPFKGDVGCYAGEFWFSGNRRAIEVLLSRPELTQRIREHYRLRPNVDESYFHTILCNSPLRVCPDHRRYIDWNKPAAHPKMLDESDLDRMFASGCWFARKFAPGHPVLDAIDAYLGLMG